MLQKEPVDEDVAAADAFQEDQPDSVVEKANIAPGHVALAGEEVAERKMSDGIQTAKPQQRYYTETHPPHATP